MFMLFQSALPWKVSRDFVAGTAKHLAGGVAGVGAVSKSPPASAPTTASPQRAAVTHDQQLTIIMPVLCTQYYNRLFIYCTSFIYQYLTYHVDEFRKCVYFLEFM